MAAPSPQTWTLRLKSHRTTVLLHVDPLQSFSAIKATLYTALQETGLESSADGLPIPLPASASDIRLGRPIDPLDAAQGFVLGEWEAPAADDEVAIDEPAGNGSGSGSGNGKGKGKAGPSAAAAARGRKAGDADAKDCPKGAGLKDGAVLAFRWEGDGTEERGSWGVRLASFEDAYGVVNEGDVGARAEFEG